MHPLTDFWRSVEALHSVVYFAPDARERYEAVGLKGWWMGYAASRSAALGTPAAPVVVATFHGFAPRLVERVVPDAWRLADVGDVLDTRLALARDALAPGLGGHDVAVGAVGAVDEDVAPPAVLALLPAVEGGEQGRAAVFGVDGDLGDVEVLAHGARVRLVVDDLDQVRWGQRASDAAGWLLVSEEP